MVIVLAPLTKHGPNHRYTKARHSQRTWVLMKSQAKRPVTSVTITKSCVLPLAVMRISARSVVKIWRLGSIHSDVLSTLTSFNSKFAKEKYALLLLRVDYGDVSASVDISDTALDFFRFFAREFPRLEINRTHLKALEQVDHAGRALDWLEGGALFIVDLLLPAPHLIGHN